jgi:hypothetical protein
MDNRFLENRISFDSFINIDLPKWFIYILLIFVFLWAFTAVMDFLRKKSGIEAQSKSAHFDIIPFLIHFFKYSGIGMLLSCFFLFLLKVVGRTINMDLSGVGVLLFCGILVLYISKSLRVYFKEKTEKE